MSGGRYRSITPTHTTAIQPRKVIPCFSSNQTVGTLKALAQSRHPVSYPANGSCTGGTLTEWVFSFLCVFSVFCGVKRFMVAKVQILPPPSSERLPTAGQHPQMQLCTRYGWPLAHNEFLRPLTGFVFSPAGSPYP